MEFLININIAWPESMSRETIDELSTSERAMAADLASKGVLKRMWRVPGRLENWGLWEARDASEMHAYISNLPVWPYMDVKVITLATHAVDPINE